MTAFSREAVLDRIRVATCTVASDPARLAADYDALPRPYIRAGKLSREECIKLLVERLREYDAEVVECEPGELTATIAIQLAGSGRHSFLAPPGLHAEWLAVGLDWKIDHELSTDEINRAEGVVTAAFCAIADSGTIVLHHSPEEGRRVLTLLPDWHLCILRASQVVETLPEYFARCSTPPPLVTWISGPSATADIEMTRIKGVHGPRFLHVILVRNE
jgi:L-lactate dehydrogenase complex protein LldG